MNWKRSLAVVPLSAALLLPATTVFGHDHSDNDDYDDNDHYDDHEYDASVSTPAADLRAELDHYLSEHAFLAVVAMQKGIDGADDFEEAAGALDENTDDLTEAITGFYGEESGEMFRDLWEDHIEYFVDYVMATAEDDEEGREAALEELDDYKNNFSEFLETATEERLEADALAEGLQMHIDQLIWAFDQYNDGEFDSAYDNARESIHHMYGVSKGLSTALVDQFSGDFDGTYPDTPAADLRADLNYLFSEHAALAVVAMQKGIDDADDFEAAADALNENTEDLTETVASVYGDEAGEAFKDEWNDHIDYFVDYVTATAEDDEAGREEALDNLDDYRESFSALLEEATEERLDAAELSEGLEMHIDQLIMAFDSYHEEDYGTAYDYVREAYAHMFGVGENLSWAIVDQFPEDYESGMPSEMPATGMGGMSDSSQGTPWYLYVIVPVIIAAAFMILTRRQSLNH